MIYPYRCRCGYETEVFRPSSESNNALICTICGRMMDRVWTSFSVHIGSDRPRPPAGAVEIGNEYNAITNLPKPKRELSRDEVQKAFAEYPTLGALPD